MMSERSSEGMPIAMLLKRCGLFCLLLLAVVPRAASSVGWDTFELGRFYRVADVTDPVVQRAARAIVSFGHGTGFVISPDGFILTNHHISRAFGKTGHVTLDTRAGGQRLSLPVRLVSTVEALDLALYKTEVADLPWLRIRTGRPDLDEPVFVLGHPMQRETSVSFGTVRARDVVVGGIESVEYSALSLSGSSGSPVLDRTGAVVAIHWGWDAHGDSNGLLTGVAMHTAVSAVSELAHLALPRRRVLPTICLSPEIYRINTRLLPATSRRPATGFPLDYVAVTIGTDYPECLDAIGLVRYELPTTARPVFPIKPALDFQPHVVEGRNPAHHFGVALPALAFSKTRAQVFFAKGDFGPIEIEGTVTWR